MKTVAIFTRADFSNTIWAQVELKFKMPPLPIKTRLSWGLYAGIEPLIRKHIWNISTEKVVSVAEPLCFFPTSFPTRLVYWLAELTGSVNGNDNCHWPNSAKAQLKKTTDDQYHSIQKPTIWCKDSDYVSVNQSARTHSTPAAAKVETWHVRSGDYFPSSTKTVSIKICNWTQFGIVISIFSELDSCWRSFAMKFPSKT